ncbi:MAG: SET domain-containing protein-lysine N-methyltransferase, partial [Legionella sp.]|nr:SET domain-containing protein-lysine N-methyltransferase [Legionella sp.]
MLVNLDDVDALVVLEKTQEFKYIFPNNNTTNPFEEVEDNLQIGSVAALGTGSKAYGMFVKNHALVFNSKQEMVLGVYKGEQLALNRLNSASDTSYVFMCSDNKTAIDARLTGNWSRFINSTFCRENANVTAVYRNKKIFFLLQKTIKAGEQLLFYYGDLYFQNVLPNDKVFLRSGDTEDDSEAIVLKNKVYYLPKNKINLDSNFLSCFYNTINSEQLFHIPKKNKLKPDLPILACDLNGAYLPQSEQENLPCLMLACYEGDVKYIQFLLKQGADVNIQTTRQGIGVFHLLAAAPLPVALKKTIADLLYQYGAVLHLQDKHDRTFLHWTIDKTRLEPNLVA